MPSGSYFGHARIGGRIVQKSRDTSVFTTVKLRLGEFLKAQRKRVLRPVVAVFSEARASHEADLSNDHVLEEANKHYRRNCIKALLRTIETAGARQSPHCADFVRFLAFSGCRLGEARKVTWSDVDLARQEIRVHTGKHAKTSGTAAVRLVPIILPMRELLERLESSHLADLGNGIR